MKTGDILICIKSSNKSLTEGQEYKALHAQPGSVTIINDHGEKGSYFSSRFIVKHSVVEQEEIDIEINI